MTDYGGGIRSRNDDGDIGKDKPGCDKERGGQSVEGNTRASR